MWASLAFGGKGYYLEGVALKNSFMTGIVNWLRDALDVNQVPFQISCAKEP